MFVFPNQVSLSSAKTTVVDNNTTTKIMNKIKKFLNLIILKPPRYNIKFFTYNIIYNKNMYIKLNIIQLFFKKILIKLCL